VIAEVRNLDELRIALQAGRMDRVLLDNFPVPNLREALTVMRNHATDGAESMPATEASGNIRLENLVEYAETGVDFLSVGALTHSVEALDLSLKISEVQRH
jgi:nicotinate-nucleotide pyrophosphorylase (carboxylating)